MFRMLSHEEYVSMNRTLASFALIGLCIVSASAAQAQSTLPEVARDPKGTIAPSNGTAEQAFVKERLQGAGYTGVNSLIRDSAGTWHALAYKGPADVAVAYDLGGHITEMPR
jgi:hypothetical protein